MELCGIALRGSVRCGAVRYGAVRSGAVRCGAVRWSAVRLRVLVRKITYSTEGKTIVPRLGKKKKPG